MAPAILFCPSSSAVQLLGHASPSKSLVLSASHGSSRHLAHTHWTTEFLQKAAHSSSFAGKCRENIYPFAWRRVYAAAAVEEPAVDSSTESPMTIAAADEGSNAEPKSVGKKAFSRSNSSSNRAVVVSPDELVSGATFTGKVTTIQPFGAFIDFGAFTNGLVHISRLSKGYVQKVEDVVQVGQDVNVQIVDVDFTTKRISLMLVEEESKADVQKEGEVVEKQLQDRPQQQNRGPRRDMSKRARQSTTPTTTMKKGEIATATVKNIIRGGVFLTLPDGTDGYLPAGEIVFKTPNTNLEAQFQVGQEVTVKVLRLEKGRVTLTTKQEMDYTKINEDLNKDVVAGATNPFEIAFRRNALIASFLADRDKQKGEADVPSADRPSSESIETQHANGVVSEEISEQEKTSADDAKEHESSKEPVTSAKEVPATSQNESSPAESVENEEAVIAAGKEDVKETLNGGDALHAAEVVGANAQQS